jgi:hypothetical protein
MEKEGPNGRRSKDLTPKSKIKLLGGEGAKEERRTWNVIWRENLINLIMFLMLRHTMLRK